MGREGVSASVRGQTDRAVACISILPRRRFERRFLRSFLIDRMNLIESDQCFL